jgi:branched-chain amino acid transport system permease protein
MADALAQATLNGLMMGWLYVLIALGLTLIFGILRIIQFAHGEIYMLGAYVSYALVGAGLPLWLALLVSCACLAAAGYGLERWCFRRLRGEVHRPIIFSLGLLLVLQSGAVNVFGLTERVLPRLSERSLTWAGVELPLDRVIAVGIAVALVALVFGFLKGTRHGLAVVACAENPEGAVLQGVDPNVAARIVMSLGCALAAIGGTVAGSILQLSPFMGAQTLSKGLVIIVLGGLGSLGGTVAAGLFLGLSDSLANVYFGAAFAAVFPLLMVSGILLLRPEGLFGHA